MMALLVHDSGECEVLVRDDFLNKHGQNQDVIYCTEVQKRDCYRVRDLHRSGFRPSLILDIGGQIGTFSMMARKYWPDAAIHSYEPVASQCELLRRNVPTASVHQTAVIGFCGKEQANSLYQCSYHVHDPEAPYRERKRPALCVEQALLQSRIGSISLLKIDCEECEVNIFRELSSLKRLSDIERIHGEWHGLPALDEIERLLSPTHDLEVVRHGERGGLFFCSRREIRRGKE